MSTDAHDTAPVMPHGHDLSALQPSGRPTERSENVSVQQDPIHSIAFDSSAYPDEDWTNVSDLAERRRIQNRVAQRNYRKKLKERPVGFEGDFRIPRPEDRLIDEMFLQLTQKRGWHKLPEQAQRQILAYPLDKKWTLVYQDRLIKWQGEQKRRTTVKPGQYQTLDVKASAADRERSKWSARKVTNDNLDTKGLGSFNVTTGKGSIETKTTKSKDTEQLPTEEAQSEPYFDLLSDRQKSLASAFVDRRAQSSKSEPASSTPSTYSHHSESYAMVALFVDFLVRDPSIDSLLAITTSEFGSSPASFTRNFSRTLKSYSQHLQQWVGGSKDVREKYLGAAKFVRNARYQVSNMIASRYNEKVPATHDLKHREVDFIPPHYKDSVPEENDVSSSDDERDENEPNFTIADLKQFFLSGEPWQLLKRNLCSLAVPDEFLYCIYESTRDFLYLTSTGRRLISVTGGLLHVIANGRDIRSDLSMQLRLMAAELKSECTDISQLDAAIFLETYSQYISVVAIDHFKDTFIALGQNARDFSPIHERESTETVPNLRTKGTIEYDPSAAIPHKDVLEKVMVDALPSVLYVDLLPHETFLASSSACASFIDALRGLASPTFFSEATTFLKATVLSAEKSEDRLLASEGQHVLAILSEMQSCLQQRNTLISFTINPSETRMTALNSAKLAIEASTASEWDWWPLQPPRHPRDAAKAELSWNCSCGTKRRKSTLPYYANELKRIFDNFPLSPGGSSGHIGQPPSSLSNTSSQGARSTQSSNSSAINSTSGGQSASISSSTADSSITPPNSVVDFSTGPRRYIYVFLLIKTSEYTLDTIDVSSMQARDFFQALRAAYRKHRGLWRRALSVFVYNHCDFIKIIKPEPETFMPGELKFELPADHDDEYHYRPRPTYSAPITKHMFRHYFYGCYDSGTLSHRLHACMPLAPTCRIRNPAAELLEFVPKRDRPAAAAAAAQSDKVEVCYGLVARERRSFFRVVVYLCFIMAPAFWFVFAWLFVWGGRGDLQDATVPMTLTLAVLSIFWAFLYSGSDIRKEYGDGLN